MPRDWAEERQRQTQAEMDKGREVLIRKSIQDMCYVFARELSNFSKLPIRVQYERAAINMSEHFIVSVYNSQENLTRRVQPLYTTREIREVFPSEQLKATLLLLGRAHGPNT